MNPEPSIRPSAPLPTASLREQSASTIRAAIHSPSDDGRTLARATACLALYFEPEDDPAIRAAVREAFVRALRGIPEWAMLRAFDRWERAGHRRPTPAEIVILAEREVEPLRMELKRREPPPTQIEARRDTLSDERRAAIMAEAGFDGSLAGLLKRFPMARSVEEAKEAAAEPPAFRPTAAQIERARATNDLVAEARAFAAREPAP